MGFAALRPKHLRPSVFLPIGEMGGTPQSIEIGLGAFGGTVAKSFGPVFRPADIIDAGGRLDRPGGEDLEEALAGRGDALAGWIRLSWPRPSCRAREPGNDRASFSQGPSG